MYKGAVSSVIFMGGRHDTSNLHVVDVRVCSGCVLCTTIIARVRV